MNNMKLNSKKCASMKVSFLLNNPQEPPLTISNIPLQEVQVAKILGVNISDDLRWSVHVAEILKKANGRLYMLKLLKRFNLPHDDLVTIFTGFVRPLAKYAAPIWHCGLTIYRLGKDPEESVQDHHGQALLILRCSPSRMWLGFFE